MATIIKQIFLNISIVYGSIALRFGMEVAHALP